MDRLDDWVAAFVIFEELLHIFERVAKLRVIQQAQFVIFFEHQRDVRGDLGTVQADVVVAFLDYIADALLGRLLQS